MRSSHRRLQFQEVNKGTSIQGVTKNLNTNYILSLVNYYQAIRKTYLLLLPVE